MKTRVNLNITTGGIMFSIQEAQWIYFEVATLKKKKKKKQEKKIKHRMQQQHGESLLYVWVFWKDICT